MEILAGFVEDRILVRLSLTVIDPEAVEVVGDVKVINGDCELDWVKVAVFDPPKGFVRVMKYLVPSRPAGIASSILDELIEIMLIGTGTLLIVISKVHNWAGHAVGNPKPCKTMEPPLTEPVIEFVEITLVIVRGSELVSPTGSSLTLTK